MSYQTGNSRVMDEIGARLRHLYSDRVDAPVPQSIADLMKELERLAVEPVPLPSEPTSEWDLSCGPLSA